MEEWKAKLKEDRERELAKGRKYQQESAEQAEMVRERVNRERRKQVSHTGCATASVL